MDAFNNLHEFMLFTKGAAYILVGLMILGILGFWLYLTSRDEDKNLK